MHQPPLKQMKAKNICRQDNPYLFGQAPAILLLRRNHFSSKLPMQNVPHVKVRKREAIQRENILPTRSPKYQCANFVKKYFYT
ncbi:hypothetical protein POVWA2_009480 [Plasmodium ovale wallikeri]|uniref:Uncharacterized protein n=1 Tax=Plasmodium ovale wallikeri TaxID=864142 RepID=A0A1A8YKL9_PLAOA|nr:hypothetical protein POVWA1_009470 [Plasmodium ovale wallikeri]SBT32428.1 hypothetical protein POVWA2_009480 [Plasmodium ovale wallikeri]